VLCTFQSLDVWLDGLEVALQLVSLAACVVALVLASWIPCCDFAAHRLAKL